MGRTILLRRKDGTVGGYAVCTEDAFVFRAKDQLEGYAEVVISRQCEPDERISVSADGEEHRYPPVREFSGICVQLPSGQIVLRDRCSASYGEPEKPESIETRKNIKAERAETWDIDLKDTKHLPPEISEESRAVPQRRWPLPPCMPEAQYDGGRWKL